MTKLTTSVLRSPPLRFVLAPMHLRLVVIATIALLGVACRDDAQTSPDPAATETPGAFVTPAPTTTSEFVDVIFCEKDEDGVPVYERCPPGTPGSGFVAQLHVSDLDQFPIGIRIPWCIVRQPQGTGWRVITDAPCAYDGVMKDGLRPIPPLLQDIQTCAEEVVLRGSPPAACVSPFEGGSPRVLTGEEAVEYLTSLFACTAALGAYRDLRELYEPVIDALGAYRDRRILLAVLEDAVEPLFAYEFDARVERSSKPEEFRGVHEWHEEVMDALDLVLDGDRTALSAALETIEEAHRFFGLGRGCGG
jgi:hypothetical protein